MRPPNKRSPSRQLIEPFAEPVQAEREADTLFGGLEDDEGRGLGAAQLSQQLVVHHHFGNAAIGQAGHEAGAADILVIEFEGALQAIPVPPSPYANQAPRKRSLCAYNGQSPCQAAADARAFA